MWNWIRLWWLMSINTNKKMQYYICCYCRRPRVVLRDGDIPRDLCSGWGDRNDSGAVRPHADQPVRQTRLRTPRLWSRCPRAGRRTLLRAPSLWNTYPRPGVRQEQALSGGSQAILRGFVQVCQRCENTSHSSTTIDVVYTLLCLTVKLSML